MFPTFFKHKMREIGSFLRIMKGKVTGNDQERIKGVDQASNTSTRGGDFDKPIRNGQEKVLRESGGQDISAI